MHARSLKTESADAHREVENQKQRIQALQKRVHALRKEELQRKAAAPAQKQARVRTQKYAAKMEKQKRLTASVPSTRPSLGTGTSVITEMSRSSTARLPKPKRTTEGREEGSLGQFDTASGASEHGILVGALLEARAIECCKLNLIS